MKVGSPGAALSFVVPEGRLDFSPEGLDPWAEHLVWCYRLLGVREGSTIAVQDFGPSPLSFLASRLVTPFLEAGVAERLGGRAICLDASRERVALTTSLLAQIRPDVLVVRGEIAGLLLAAARAQRLDLSAGGATQLVLAVCEEERVGTLEGAWRRLLLVERAMLFAPLCERCGHFHLRARRYKFDGTTAQALGPAEFAPYTFRQLSSSRQGGCPEGPDDLRVHLDFEEAT
jgi:hypothetical protein